MLPKTRVVVVDDSALVRSLLGEIINRQADMVCVGAAADPLVAREMIRELNPDVITLDVEMPRMDGIEFLSRLMRLRPMPVVMVSTLTERGAEVTMRALELGAVDFVAKPKIGVSDGLSLLADDITAKIRIAARAHLKRAVAPPAGTPPRPVSAPLGRLSTEKIVFIGASTGGTEATKEVLVHLPADAPAVMITQHMPPGFTRSYATRLDGLCRIARQGGQRRRARAARPCLHRPGRPAPERGAFRRQLRGPGARRRAGEPPQALGGGAVRIGGARGRTQCAGRDAHRHGRRRRQGDAR
jgi:two-component system, chemotaxis family, protein-glutamate methylesterase/glutaminase